MSRLILSLISSLVSHIIPPRASERMVESLSPSLLRALVRADTHTYEGMLPYHDPRVKALVWELKFYHNPKALSLAGTILSERVGEIVAEVLEPVILIPIPMDPGRRRERGGNHTEALCNEIKRRLGDSCDVSPLLIKQKETPRQVELPATARRENLKNAFAFRGDTSPARTYVVIDDVTTTGATFEEAASTLKQAGASCVLFLALARS